MNDDPVHPHHGDSTMTRRQFYKSSTKAMWNALKDGTPAERAYAFVAFASLLGLLILSGLAIKQVIA